MGKEQERRREGGDPVGGANRLQNVDTTAIPLVGFQLLWAKSGTRMGLERRRGLELGPRIGVCLRSREGLGLGLGEGLHLGI